MKNWIFEILLEFVLFDSLDALQRHLEHHAVVNVGGDQVGRQGDIGVAVGHLRLFQSETQTALANSGVSIWDANMLTAAFLEVKIRRFSQKSIFD